VAGDAVALALRGVPQKGSAERLQARPQGKAFPNLIVFG
jgi:hypothetical protein